MKCAQERCPASIQWFGHPDDPALATFARQSGWRMYEGSGWICPHHQQERTKAMDEIIAGDADTIAAVLKIDQPISIIGGGTIETIDADGNYTVETVRADLI